MDTFCDCFSMQSVSCSGCFERDQFDYVCQFRLIDKILVGCSLIDRLIDLKEVSFGGYK